VDFTIAFNGTTGCACIASDRPTLSETIMPGRSRPFGSGFDLDIKTLLLGSAAGNTEVICPSNFVPGMVSVSTLNLLPNFICGTAISATAESRFD